MTASIDGVAEAAADLAPGRREPEIAARRSGDVQRAAGAGRVRPGQGRLRRGAQPGRLAAVADRRARQRRPGPRRRRPARCCGTSSCISRGTMVVLLVVAALLLRRWVLLPVIAAAQPDAGGRGRQPRGGGARRRAAGGRRDRPGRREHAPTDRRRARGGQRAATEALTQHSPVVSLLRSELTSHPRAEADGLEIVGHGALGRGGARGRLVGGAAAARRQHRAGAGRRLRPRRRGGPGGVRLQAADHRAARHRPRPRRPRSRSRPGTEGDDERFLSCLVVVVDPRRRSGCPGSTRATRRPWSSTGSAGRTSPSSCPTGPLISSVTAAGRSRRRRSAPTTCWWPAPTGCSRPATLDGERVRRRRGCWAWCAGSPLERRGGGRRVPGGGAAVRGRRTPRRRHLRRADPGSPPAAAAGLTGIRDRVPRLGHRWHSGDVQQSQIIIS